MLNDTVRRRLTDIRKRMMEEAFRRRIEERPEVLTHGRPELGDRVRRAQVEARFLLERRIAARGGASPCPAAATFHAATETRVRCGVERTLLAVRTDPQSMVSFCFGDYTLCPSWRAEKENEWAGRRLPLVPVSEGV